MVTAPVAPGGRVMVAGENAMVKPLARITSLTIGEEEVTKEVFAGLKVAVMG